MSTVTEPVVPPVVDEPVTGMSLRALAWRRLRRDRGAMFAMYLLIFIFLTAIFTPLIVSLLGLDPYAFDGTALDPSQGSLPAGPWGGASLDHPLCVEPLTGHRLHGVAPDLADGTDVHGRPFSSRSGLYAIRR